MKMISCSADLQITAADNDFSQCTTSTYSGLHITLWPCDDETESISPRDIAKHLSKVVYFPESVHSPFSAAQYAVELANSLKNASSHVRLYALLRNVHEAYLGHISSAVRAAEKSMASQRNGEDGRDALESAFSARIFKALNLLTPQAASERNLITTENLAAIEHARQRLDSTLERDLGVYIHKQNHAVNFMPLPRFIVPLRWDRASDKYLHSYQRLVLDSRKIISEKYSDI
ncbi:MAG TPA: hypothetical protein VKA94_08760 [Hyphomicrobiales bacterium]|nr:hypothetical protein [Hyphomicrobiales bacterium]